MTHYRVRHPAILSALHPVRRALQMFLRRVRFETVVAGRVVFVVPVLALFVPVRAVEMSRPLAAEGDAVLTAHCHAAWGVFSALPRDILLRFASTSLSTRQRVTEG